MPYEVCYRALLSISVVEGLKPHTHTRDAPPRAGASTQPLPRPALAGLSVFRFHPEDSLAGGPPARWFVIRQALFRGAMNNALCIGGCTVTSSV